MRKRLVAIAVAICVAFPPLSSRAEDNASARIEEAKRLFREGNALRNTGDCEGALALYLRSKAIVPSIPNLTNAAYCAQRIGRLDEALALYEELTVRFSGELTTEDRSAIAPAMAELRKRVGLLDVTANVPGTVVVDGRPRGQLPLLAPIRVLAGARRVQVMYEGWAAFDQTLSVRSGETIHVDAKLRPLLRQGRLRVDAGVAGLDVYVDAVNVGQTPWEGALAPGEHVFWLEGRDAGTGPTAARVMEGRTTKLSVRPGAVGPRVTLLVEPRTASLAIDGARIRGESFSGRLPLGAHRIDVEEPGYVRTTRTIRGERGGNIVISLAIDPNHPRWGKGQSGVVFGEARLGTGYATGIASGAARSCDRYECEQDPAFGFVGSVHAGYELPSSLAFQIGVGVLAFTQTIDRRVNESYVPAAGAVAIQTQYRLKDELSIAGPFLALGIAQRFPLGSASELSTALEVGAVAFAARDRVSGIASGGGVERQLSLSGSGDVKRSLDVFVAPEVFFSTRVGPIQLLAGLEVAFFLLEGPALETGDLNAVGGTCTSPTIDCAPGESSVAGERSYGRFVALLPQLGARYDF